MLNRTDPIDHRPTHLIRIQSDINVGVLIKIVIRFIYDAHVVISDNYIVFYITSLIILSHWYNYDTG